VRFGNRGSAEMCIVLAFTDAPTAFAGGVLRGEPTLVGEQDGVAIYRGDCEVSALPR
jgi:hypothetical protein